MYFRPEYDVTPTAGSKTMKSDLPKPSASSGERPGTNDGDLALGRILALSLHPSAAMSDLVI